MTTQTSVLIVEKFYAIAEIGKAHQIFIVYFGGWGGVGRRKGIHSPHE